MSTLFRSILPRIGKNICPLFLFSPFKKCPVCHLNIKHAGDRGKTPPLSGKNKQSDGQSGTSAKKRDKNSIF